MTRFIPWTVSQFVWFAAAVLVAAPSALATNYSWNNGSSGVLFFSDPANWAPNGVPATNDTSTFSLNNSYTVRFSTGPYIEGLTVSAGNPTWGGFLGAPGYFSVDSAVSIYNSVGNTALTLGTTGNPLYLFTRTLSVGNGAALTVQDDSQVNCRSFGLGLNGNVTVDASGFALDETTGLDQYIGSGGGSGSLTIQNGHVGSVHSTGGAMSLRIGDDTTPSTGVLAIHSGATFSAYSNILLATRNLNSTATIYVDGVNSALNQYDYYDGFTTSPSGITVGSASLGTAAIYVGDLPTGGTLTTGTGGLVINKTGTVQVGSFSTTGKLIANGNVTVHGGVLWTRFGSEFFMPVGWKLTIDDGGTANMESYNPTPGTVNFVSGSFSYFGDLEVGPGGLLGADLSLDSTRHLSPSGKTTIDASHTLTVSGGLLNTASLVNNGTLVLDNPSPIHLPELAVGDVTLNPGSTLHIDLSKFTSGILTFRVNGALTASGAVSLNGALQVSSAGLALGAGDSFDILDWGTRSGAFSTLSLPTLAAGLGWNVSQLYTTGMISVLSTAGVPGDYNHNGLVDSADYVVWRNNQGTTNALPNDPIGGTIGTAQYNQWRSHFGQTAGSGSGASAATEVPEPSTLGLLLVGVAAMCVRRRANLWSTAARAIDGFRIHSILSGDSLREQWTILH